MTIQFLKGLKDNPKINALLIMKGNIMGMYKVNYLIFLFLYYKSRNWVCWKTKEIGGLKQKKNTANEDEKFIN